MEPETETMAELEQVLELAAMQLEFEMSKQDVQQEETGDDGFLSAMNAVAQEVWGDESV